MPDLINVYENLQNAGQNFEVIYVSSDRSPETFSEYFEQMPWLAFPYGDPRIAKITKHFNVKGIPTLLLLDENDELITPDGRTVISKDRDGNNFPWPTPVFEVLSESNANHLNDAACLILFTDGNVDLIASAPKLLLNIAQRYCDDQKSSRTTDAPLPELHFFYEGPESSEVTDQLRAFVFADSTPGVPLHPRLALLDIPEQRYHAVLWDSDDPSVDPVHESTVQRLVDDFKSGKLRYVSLQR